MAEVQAATPAVAVAAEGVDTTAVAAEVLTVRLLAVAAEGVLRCW